MALELQWYDFICLAIVIGLMVVSLWAIWKKECAAAPDGSRHSRYESLQLVSGVRYDGADHVVFTEGHVEATMLWMSCWSWVHPAWLLVFRLAAVVALGAALLWDMRTYDPTIMMYYTEWTFLLVIIYFVIATLISANGCWVHSKQETCSDDEANALLKADVEPSRTNKRAGSLGHLMQIIYQATAGAVVLTDVVFWGLIEPFMSSTHFSLNAIMGCMHSLNLVFLLIETALNSLPFPWFRMAYLVLWTCAYVIFQWILHACGFSWWPYPFLELATPWAPLWYFGMALLHIPCYGVYWLIVKAKNICLPKLFPHSFMR